MATLPPQLLSLPVSPRFLIKGSVAGGAVYLVYDQELLGPSDKSEAALRKAEEVVPPAMYQFSQYVCQQTGLEMPQLPAPPKINFPNFRDSWNSGRPPCPCLGYTWTCQPCSQPCLPCCSFPFLPVYLCACMSPMELSRNDWAWWHMPVSLAFGRWRQEDFNSRLTWSTK